MLATHDARYQRALDAHRREQTRKLATGGGVKPWPVAWFVRDDGRTYIPNHGQEGFHKSPARFRIIFGGRGSGKSTAGANEALTRIRQGKSGAVINPDFENFKISTWPEFRRWIPWEHVIERDRYMGAYGWEPHQPFTLHFDTGAWVICKGLKNPDAARGPNINWLWYDEGGRDPNGISFRNAVGGVRVGDDPTAFVTTTPRGTFHWTNKLFVMHETPEYVQTLLDEIGYQGAMYAHFFASIHDNRANLDPAYYVAMLSTYQGREAEQELEGKIITGMEGAVYEDFDNENLTDEEPDPTKPIELAFDDGYIDPRVFLYIQKTPSQILIFDEQYHSHHLEETCVSEMVDYCKEKWGLDKDGKPNKLPEIACGSPEAKTLHTYFRKANIPVRSIPIPSVVEALKPIRKLIKDNNGVRVLKVHVRCKRFIEEMVQGYRYPEGGTKSSTEKPLDQNNHGPDALRDWAWVRARRL